MRISSDGVIKEPILPAANGEIKDGLFLVCAKMNIAWHFSILSATPLVTVRK